MNALKPLPWLRSFSWRGFLVYVGFSAALSTWMWSGILFNNEPMSVRDEFGYLLLMLQRTFLNFFPAYLLATLVDGSPLRGSARRVALGLALVGGLFLAVQSRCLWSNDIFYAYEATLLPYCTTFPTWQTFIDFPAHWITNLAIAAMVTICIVTMRRDRELVRTLHAARAAQLENRRQWIESEMEAMQSRVDPDKLLDTLRLIRGLYERSVAEGEATLEELIVSLRRAAGHPEPETAD